MRIRRWVIGLSMLLVLLLAAPLLVAWYALYTQGGLALVVRLVPEQLPKARLTLQGVRGTLTHALHADLVEVRTQHADVKLHDVDLEPSLELALLQTLLIKDATIGSLEVQVFRHPSSSKPLRFLPHWLNVHVDALRIKQFHLILPSGRHFDSSNLTTHGIVRARVARYYDARMQTGGVNWRSDEGILHGTRTLGIDAGLSLGYHNPGQVPWDVRLDGHGDLDALNLSARILQPFDASYVGQALGLAGTWHLKGNLDVQRITLNTWGGNPVMGDAHGTLHLEGNLDGFSAQGPVLIDRLKAGSLDLRLQAAYANRTLKVEHAEFHQPQAGWRVFTQGDVTVIPGGPQLALTGNWIDLGLPLAARPDGFHSHAATFSITGTWPYRVHSAGDLFVPHLPTLGYTLEADVYKDHAEVSTATVAMAAAKAGVKASATTTSTGAAASGSPTPSASASARFSGRLAWPQPYTWAANGTLADFDPSAFAARVPHGHLSFGFDAHGTGLRPDSDFSLSLRDIAGSLRELPAHGSGSVSRQGSLWHFDAVRLQVGGAAIALDGSLGQSLNQEANVRFDLRAPDLGLLQGGWHGRLEAAGTVHGTVRNPSINASASGSTLQYDQVSLGSIDARIDADTNRSADSHVLLHVRDLAVGSRRIDEAQLALDGATLQHHLALHLRARDFHLDGAGSGSFNNGAWNADLTELRARGGDAVNLALASPATLLLSTSAVRLSSLCLTGQPGKLCASGDWTTERWSLNSSASGLPMQTLTAGQSGTLDYRGTIGLQLNLSGQPGQPTVGGVDAHLEGAQLLHKLANGKVETTTLGSGSVVVTASAQDIVAKLGLDAGPIGSLNGLVTVQRGAADWHAMPLSGQLQLTTAELDFIPLYVPQVDRAAGRLEAGLQLSGTLGAPLLAGTLSVSHGELDLYRVNLALRDASINAALSGNSLQFDGAAQLGAGHAAVKGQLQWQNTAPHGSFTLIGDNLRVADVPEAQVDASPNLNFSVDGTRIAVTGSVKIPHAHLAPADLTNAVLPSSDEIIVSDVEARNPASRFAVTSDITLSLGDDVSIEARGLKARLGGSITTHAGSDEQVTHASGEVNVIQGEYTAYGRKLTIDRGRLIFSGGSVADPAIDVRAVKHFDDPTVGATLAGINVRGTLRAPRLSFFSEPPLPQQEIVQLILAGGGLMAGQTNNVGGSTAASRGATNNELLGQGAAIIGQQLGSKIGITDVGVESNIYNETSLVLGRYLSPRLYVSYGLGLTQTLNTVKLRYTLGDHWMLRTEAGQVGGADIVYTLDK